MKTRPIPGLLAILLLLSATAFAESFPVRQEFGQTRPAGRATITETPDGGNGGGGLIVSNIGSSGEDGIDFDPGLTRGAIGPIRWMAPEFAVGRGMDIIITGEDKNGATSRLGIRSVGTEQKILGTFDKHEVTFNPMATGVPGLSMTIRSNGNPLYTGNGMNGDNPLYGSTAPPNGTSGGGNWGDLEGVFDHFRVYYPSGTTFELMSGEIVVGDEVVLEFDPFETEMVALDLLSVLGIEPQGSTGEMFITDWPAGMFGQTVATLGGARGHGLGSSGHDLFDILGVSNIGSSGQDGVYMHTDGTSTSQGFALEFPSPPVEGNKLFVGGLSYSEGDGSGARLPTVRIEYMAGSFFEVWGDDPFTLSPSRIEYLLDGEVVHTVQSPTSGAQLYTSVQYPYQLDCMPAQDGGIDIVAFFSAPVTFQDDTGTDQNCDGVRLVHPPDPGMPFDPLDGIFLRAADLTGGEFYVTGIPNEYPPEPVSPWTSAASLGQANIFLGDSGVLVADNIGSSGQDGVRLSFSPGGDLGITMGTRSKRPPPTRGHVTVLKAWGFGGDKADHTDVMATLTAIGNDADTQVEYAADMSPLGPGPVTWNFYDDGQLVGTATRGNSDTCFGCDAIPTGFNMVLNHPDGKPRMIIDLPDDSAVTLIGGTKAVPAMNKADLVEAVYSDLIVTPFTDVTDIEWRGTGQGAMFLTDSGPVGLSDVPVASRGSALHMYPAAPNPFNPRTVIAFDLARGADVALQVYDLRGRLVRNIFQGHRSAGLYRETWDGLDDRGKGAASGTYFFRLSGAGVEQTQKAVLVR